MSTFDDALAIADARFARLREERRLPGIAWGVVRDGVLVHSGGLGTYRAGEDRTPDADTVFRIASMTKSFTAAAILLLRDEGRLRLDDPVANHVPELLGWAPPNADAAPVTIRDLLTMSAGLPTDDPWGDRQQPLALDAFARLLAAGPTFAWPPGSVFEYSNLGYGILGRVITSAAGAEYRDVVRARLLGPLGMHSTAYDALDIEEVRLAHGYVRVRDELVREGTDGYGALASMGGIFSSVRDLSAWVAGFLDAFPARSDAEGPHPLRRSSRREMQQAHRLYGAAVGAHAPDSDPWVTAGGYGYGLTIASDPDLGTFVAHSGGYPGFGSNMSWHPASGLGVIGLANYRYAGTRAVVTEVLASLVRTGSVPRRTPQPLPAAEAFQPVVEGLLEHWDDDVADAAFAMNMDLDEPREIRRANLAALALDLGPFTRDPARPTRSDSPADLTWWLRGASGRVGISLLVTPEPAPRIQALAWTPVPDPSAALVGAAEAVLAVLGEPAPAWPASVIADTSLDVEAVVRALRAGAARFGAVSLGLPSAGDGRTEATWDLLVERSAGTLRIALDRFSGAVTACELRVALRGAPAEGW